MPELGILETDKTISRNAKAYCDIRHDPTKLCFDYVDKRGSFINYMQTDTAGEEYYIIRWAADVEVISMRGVSSALLFPLPLS